LRGWGSQRDQGADQNVGVAQAQPIGPKPKGKKSGRNTPQFDLRTELYRITGIDWAQVNGMDVVTAQTVLVECGADLSASTALRNAATTLVRAKAIWGRTIAGCALVWGRRRPSPPRLAS
jgi:hypothetical protein